MSTEHLAAFRAGGLVNQAIWHLEQAIFTCNAGQAARFVDVLGQLETQVLAMPPATEARPVQQRLHTIADDWHAYPSEAQAEEWHACFRHLDESYGWYPDTTSGGIDEVFSDFVLRFDQIAEEVHRLVEGNLPASEVIHTAFLLGTFVCLGSA